MSEPLIRAVALRKEYRLGEAVVQALRGMTLDIGRGEFIAIMGPSGSGKSTLMHLLGLLDRPTDGSLSLDGQDTTRFDHDQRAGFRLRNIGFVFQNFSLLGRSTARENVELPLLYGGVPAAERRRRVAAALEKVGLAHRADHWPGQLSGGEQQRIAIARALVNDPLLILADEPTGALDTATGLEIMMLIEALNAAGTTIVMVTHDPMVARHAGRIILMKDGRLAAHRTLLPAEALP